MATYKPTQCTQTGKNIKSIIPTTQISELPTLFEPNEELNLDFAGPLDNNWGNNKYILLCIDRFSKFPSAKITSSTSSNTVIEFLQDYFYLHGIPNSIRVDHASCFTSQDFKLFCNSLNIKLIFCTVGDHRSNGLVEKLVHTVKIKLLAMSLEQQKPTLQIAISKIIWNLRSSFQSKIKCSPFEIHFNRKPNTIWKQLASNKLSGGFLDKGKSILSRERALDWNADDRIEDGYKDLLVPKKNQSPLEKGYDSDLPTTSKPSSSRVALNSPFKGNLLRKTNGSINGNPFYKQLGQKIINSTKSTVELSDGKIIRKSDIVIPKSKSSTIRSFKGNVSFPFFSNSDLQVGPRKTNKAKIQQTRNSDTMTGRHTESFTPVTTRSRGTRQPTKSNKPKRNRNKASTSNTGYLAGDESMFIPSDTSDISDWEWIAGGFPCREMIRKRFISDNLNFNENPSPPLAPQTYQTNIKSELLDEQLQSTDTAECPISIKPAPQSTSHTPGESSTATTTEGPNIPSDSTKVLEGENPVEFPVFEREDSSNESANSEERHPKEITTTGNDFKLRRSSRNVGPPQFYGKRYYIEIIDECENQPGSANNPISLDEGDSSGFPTLTFRENPSENQTHICDTLPEDRAPGPAYPSSPDQFSIASTDESLRDAVNNFDNYIDLDSEIFNAELEKFMEGDS